MNKNLSRIKIEEASLKDIDRIIELWKGLIDYHLSTVSPKDFDQPLKRPLFYHFGQG
ncbi:MAG: hypothetical protein QMC80_02325 [Thermoplasmatales archaeon]|nr:hypothetical protein [Thermoplasmatales archaeon]